MSANVCSEKKFGVAQRGAAWRSMARYGGAGGRSRVQLHAVIRKETDVVLTQDIVTTTTHPTLDLLHVHVHVHVRFRVQSMSSRFHM